MNATDTTFRSRSAAREKPITARRSVALVIAAAATAAVAIPAAAAASTPFPRPQPPRRPAHRLPLPRPTQSLTAAPRPFRAGDETGPVAGLP